MQGSVVVLAVLLAVELFDFPLRFWHASTPPYADLTCKDLSAVNRTVRFGSK
jgi:hypothetical protein